MALHIVASRPDPEIVHLPWSVPLDEWSEDYVVPLPRGLSRHIVRIVRLGDRTYAVKETQEEIAFREYRLLRDLQRLGLPAVQPVGVVTGRETDDDEELPCALMTQHLAFSLPYRALFAHGMSADSLPSLVDALVVLLVRLHLADFYWGDVSLSNVLFRRSAGEFAAYLVDAETGELRPALSRPMREYDVQVGVRQRLRRAARPPGRRLAQLPRRGRRDRGPDRAPLRRPLERAHRGGGVQRRRDVADPGAHRAAERPRFRRRRARHRHRLRRRPDPDPAQGRRARPPPPRAPVADRTRRRGRPGAPPPQRRRLVHRPPRPRSRGPVGGRQPLADRDVRARRWRWCRPTRARKLEPAEIFHEMLVHRWYLSERAGHEIPLLEAAPDYLENVLVKKPDELVDRRRRPRRQPRRSTRTRTPASSGRQRSRSRPITIRWIWLVPSKICVTLASRNRRSTG